jgi:hypothetical protein
MQRGNLFGAMVAALAMSGAGVAALTTGGGAAQTAGPDGWRLAAPATYENLTIFPVIAAEKSDTSGFITLDGGLTSGDVMVTEQGADVLRRSRGDGPTIPQYPQSQGASVNQLVLVNRGKKPLLLLAGELVSGGKQDRIIAKDRIVPAGAAPLPLDVFCVEHGRWSSGVQFAAGNIMVHPSVREAAAVEQEQSEVWSAVRSGSTFNAGVGGAAGAELETTGGAIRAATPAPLSPDRVHAAMAETAPTEAYQKIYTSKSLGVPLDSFVEEVQRRFERAATNLKGERIVGVVVAYGGEVAWSDVFASPELFERYWPKLLRSYAVEALARPQMREQVSIEDAGEFLKPLTGRENSETEPNVYRWREVSQGRYAEIALDALKPNMANLHWLKIHRSS